MTMAIPALTARHEKNKLEVGHFLTCEHSTTSVRDRPERAPLMVREPEPRALSTERMKPCQFPGTQRPIQWRLSPLGPRRPCSSSNSPRDAAPAWVKGALKHRADTNHLPI